MKLLYVGPLMDFSGFATASRNLLRALNESDELDITARPIRFDSLDKGQEFQTPDWMIPLLKNDLQGVDMALQMVTCNSEAVPVPGIPNGLYTFLESDRIQPSWAAKANEFDFIIVPSKHNAQSLLNSGVTKPILVAGPPCNIDDYNCEYKPFQIDNVQGRTIFYNICQLSTKKGIDILLRAYYAAFVGAPDEVLLVLKTYVNMESRVNDLEMVKQYINGVKSRCRIPSDKLPPVLPVVYTMTEEEIHGLHVRGDAYVCSSRGEGWGIPVFDALSHGNTVISHVAGGLSEFVTRDNSLLYGGASSFYYDMPHPDPGLFTGIEQCFEPSPFELAMTMQHFHVLKKGDMAGNLTEDRLNEWNTVLQRRDNAKLVGTKLDYREMYPFVVEQLIAAFESWTKTGIAEYKQPEKSLEETL